MARKTRRDKGKRQLSKRDLWVLPWIASMYAIRFDQLQVLLSREPGQRNKTQTGPQGITDSAVDQVIDRWLEDPPLVVYDRGFRYTPGWIWLTPYGERELSLPYRRHIIRKGTLTHKYYINQVRLDYEGRHPERRWKSEREIQREQPRRERGAKMPHIPDGEIWRAGVRSFAVEVELSPKSDEQMDAILEELLLEGEDAYTGVFYFVSDHDEVAREARRVVEAARERLLEDQQSHMQIIDLAKLERNAKDDGASKEPQA
jgi:hypothetical protein